MFVARSSFSVLSAALLASLSAAQVGTVLGTRKITEGQGGFTADLDDDDYLGFALTRLGDLDRDGIAEIAASAPWDGDGGFEHGAVYVLFFDHQGLVRKHSKISETSGGFTDTLYDGARMGYTIAGLGDVDGDGVGDLAVGAHGQPGTAMPGGLWILFLDRNGAVRSQTEIDPLAPIFQPPILTSFPYSLAAIGDADGNGVTELVVGLPYDDEGGRDAGAVWILNLKSDGSVGSALKVCERRGIDGATSILGGSVAGLGDVNGDGNPDFASMSTAPLPRGSTWTFFLADDGSVGRARQLLPAEVGLVGSQDAYYTSCPGDLDGDGVSELMVASVRMNGFALNFLGRDGSARKQIRIAAGQGALTGIQASSAFGAHVATIGDLGGDGTIELAVGQPYDSEAGDEVGALWILSIDARAERNGTGINPISLEQGSDPSLGRPWVAKLDCTAQGPGLALLSAWDAPLAGATTPFGELLVDSLHGHRLFVRVVPHAGARVAFAVDIPPDLALVNLAMHVQGLCRGTLGTRLSNALDVLVER